MRKSFEIRQEYTTKEKQEIVTSLTWTHKEDHEQIVKSLHGKYALITNISGESELDTWTFYNVIRTYNRRGATD